VPRDDGGNLHDLAFSAIGMVSRGGTSIVLEPFPDPPYSVWRIVEDLLRERPAPASSTSASAAQPSRWPR